MHIPSWQKFKEIIQMMDSSLQGIVDRWADGKVGLNTGIIDEHFLSCFRCRVNK